MSWKERVGVSCWLRWSRCQKFCQKVGIALQCPLSLPTGNHTFLKVMAAEYNISTYHLLTLAQIDFPYLSRIFQDTRGQDHPPFLP